MVLFLPDTFSEDSPLRCGVPQGSVLGPIFFSHYTTNLAQSDRHGVCQKFFADDTKLYRAFHPDPTSALTAVRTAEECCRDVKARMTANKLKFNNEKKQKN